MRKIQIKKRESDTLDSKRGVDFGNQRLKPEREGERGRGGENFKNQGLLLFLSLSHSQSHRPNSKKVVRTSVSLAFACPREIRVAFSSLLSM